MEVYYLDTSAAVKRYVDELGSEWLRAQLDPTRVPLVLSSRLLSVEMISALARRQREGKLSVAEFQSLEAAFKYVRRYFYTLLHDDDVTLNMACRLMVSYPLRAYDAIHLATALMARRSARAVDLLFLSSDDRLLNAARAEGLAADNPNLHP